MGREARDGRGGRGSSVDLVGLRPRNSTLDSSGSGGARGEREPAGGVCGSEAPALVRRGGRLVFTASGRALEDVIAALARGEAVDPAEERIAQAHLDRA
jgi:hypothetical protein